MSEDFTVGTMQHHRDEPTEELADPEELEQAVITESTEIGAAALYDMYTIVDYVRAAHRAGGKSGQARLMIQAMEIIGQNNIGTDELVALKQLAIAQQNLEERVGQ